MNDRINRVEFWRRLTEEQDNFDNYTAGCIDGRLIINKDMLDRIIEENMLDSLDIDEREKKAIRLGFKPDKYYSAFENMMKAKKAS
jgi:hypothetical protein